MTAMRVLGVARRSWRFLALMTLVGAVVGAGAGFVASRHGDQGPTRRYYAATETIGIDPSGIPQVPIGQFATLDGIGVFVTSDDVTRAVADRLGGNPSRLAQRVTTVVQPDANAVDVTVVAETPEDAEATADALGDVVIDQYQAQVEQQSEAQAGQVARRLEDLKARRQAVEDQLAVPGLSVVERDTLEAQRDALVNQYRITYDRFISLGTAETSAAPLYPLTAAVAEVIDADEYAAALERGRSGANHLNAEDDDAVTSTTQSSIRLSGPLPFGVLGAVFGFAIALGIVLVRDRFDQRIRTADEFERAYALPVLCGVPELDRKDLGRYPLVVADRPFSPAAEAYRSLRSSVLMLAEECAERRGALVVLVTSPHPSEGKSTTSANLAVALSESGRSVLVLNCDYQRPTLHRFFGVDDQPGVVASTDVPGAIRIVSNVDAPSGLPGHIAADQVAFIDAQRAQFDVIILDAAPVLSSSNPLDLVPAADIVVLMGRVGLTRADYAAQTVEVLQRHRANIAGVAMIGIPAGVEGYYYAYGAAVAYSSASDATPSGAARRTPVVGDHTPRPDSADRDAAETSSRESVPPTTPNEPGVKSSPGGAPSAPAPARPGAAAAPAGWTSGAVAIRWADADSDTRHRR